MADTHAETLHPVVQQVIGSVEPAAGELVIPEPAFLRLAKALQGKAETEREKLVVDLGVVAARLHRLAPEHCDQALAQVIALAAVVLGLDQEAQPGTAPSAQAMARAKAFLAQEQDKQVESRVDPQQRVQSLLGLLAKK